MRRFDIVLKNSSWLSLIPQSRSGKIGRVWNFRGIEKEKRYKSVSEWAGPELNRRHADFQSAALPPELPTLFFHVLNLTVFLSLCNCFLQLNPLYLLGDRLFLFQYFYRVHLFFVLTVICVFTVFTKIMPV